MEKTVRSVEDSFPGVETLEGAGVRLRRVFGHQEVSRLDPFLLLDHFKSSDPADYVAGFPWHPHRGIETVTYMLDGRVEHGDSLGNEGAIDSGDVQWMTAGSGIMHQEMPKRKDGTLEGFQLWVNLPSRRKMTVPAYRGLVSNDFPKVHTENGADVSVVAGTFDRVDGPVHGISVDPTYLDVTVPASGKFSVPTPRGYTAFAYVVDGSGSFDPSSRGAIAQGHLALYGDGDQTEVRAGPEGVRFLFVSGKPLREPVAWYGPIVMNSQDELRQAVVELRRGDFIKERRSLEE